MNIATSRGVSEECLSLVCSNSQLRHTNSLLVVRRLFERSTDREKEPGWQSHGSFSLSFLGRSCSFFSQHPRTWLYRNCGSSGFCLHRTLTFPPFCFASLLPPRQVVFRVPHRCISTIPDQPWQKVGILWESCGKQVVPFSYISLGTPKCLVLTDIVYGIGEQC